jgi:PAS domain S-box-containing protein
MERTSGTTGGHWRRFAWLPIPLLVSVMTVLWLADLRVSWPLPPLFWLVQYGSVALGVVFIVIPAAHSFLASGHPSVLMLGCGVLMTDIGVAAWTIGFARGLNTGFTIYNTSALLSALCHITGVAIASQRTLRIRHSAMWLTVACTGSMAAMGLVIWAASTGRMPVFFIEGQGGTLLRSLVVGTAVTLFVLTAGLLWQTNRHAALPFFYWYAMGLALVAVGLAGSMAIAVKDSPLQWITRITQVFGLVYLCVAVLVSSRRGDARVIPLTAVEEAWRENAFLGRLREHTLLGRALRYGLAAAAVAAGFGCRAVLTAWVGPGLATYITFYPAVMAVALLAGFGPGLLATAFTDVLVAYWILPPVGQFSIASPVDRVGLVVFAGMGLFMSVVAGRYRRIRSNLADLVAARTRELSEANATLTQQVALIDPARAEIIAREMQRIVRERIGPAVPPVEPSGKWLGRVPMLAGATAAAVGLLVLVGWTFGLGAFTSVVPGLATMKANTALCFLLAGAALAMRDRRGLRLACAGIIGTVAGLTLTEYVTGVELHIDQLLFHDPGNPQTAYPGRMAQATALAFLLTSVASLLLRARTRTSRWVQEALAIGVGTIGMVGMLGYAYDVKALYQFAGYSSMAVHTAVGFVALAAGLLCARSDGLVRVLTTQGPGAQVARRLLPTAILLPLVLGWLHESGERAGVFAPPVGAGLLSLVTMFFLAATVWWIASSLNLSDAKRHETESQLRNQAELMDQAREALIVREMGGAIRFWNRGAAALYGWSAAEAVGQRSHVLLSTPASTVEELETALERTGHWEGELLHTTRDGRRITVESRKTATRAPDGTLLILESNRDITERKRAEEALNQLNADLERRVAAQTTKIRQANEALEERVAERTAELQAANEKLRASRVAALSLMEDAVEARRQTEGHRAQLAAVIESMQDGLVVFDMEGNAALINEAEARINGFASSEDMKKNLAWFAEVYELVDPSGRPVPVDQWPVSRALRGESLHDFRVGARRKDTGREWFFSFSAAPIYDGQGRQILAATITRDITERRRAEEALRRSEARSKVLSDTAGRLLASEEPQGLVDELCHNVMAHLDCQAFFNFLIDEPAGRLRLNACAGIPDEEARKIEWLDYGSAVCGCVARDGQRIIAEDISRTPDPRTALVGSYGIQAYCCHPLMAQGRLIGTLSFGTKTRSHFSLEEVEMMRTVADQVATAMERVQYQYSLRESRHDLNRAQAVAHTGSWRLDVRRDVLEWSDENHRIFGIPKGTPLTYEVFLASIHPEDRDQVDTRWKAALNGEPYDVEHRIVVGDTVKWVREVAELEVDDHGNLLGGFGTTQDITERKQSEERLQHAAEELTRSNKDLEQFAYVASHDLQEPLRMVSSFVQLLSDRYRGRLDSNADEYIGFAVEGATRMQQLIQDLLAYSRVGTQGRTLTPTSIQNPLDRAFALLKGTIDASGVRITSDPMPTMRVDGTQLTQLFQNLIGNAIKFRSDTPLEIHVGARREADEWVFSVRDNGIGLDPQHAERIFVIFQRLHARERYPGTGIGLAICKKIVERHGGRIWVESEVGKGATFCFTLPA